MKSHKGYWSMTKQEHKEYYESASSWERAFGMYIMCAIKERGWTVEQTAREAGISKVTLYKIINEGNYTAKNLFKVMKVLGLTVDFEIQSKEAWERARVEQGKL